MTANEMWQLVLVEYEKLNSAGAPGVQEGEANIILTNAQNYFVHTRITAILNLKREGLEETEIRMQGLSPLITSATVSSFTNTTDNLPNGVFATLPLDFMYTILERCIIDQDDCETGEPADLPVYVISHNEFTRSRNNPFKKPYFNQTEGLVWRLAFTRTNTGYNSQTTTSSNGYSFISGQTGKRHELITDGNFNIVDYDLRYLRLPKPIKVDLANFVTPVNMQNCELDESTHRPIVDIAVKMMKESLTQPSQSLQLDAQQIE
jgi:hypothetical protein